MIKLLINSVSVATGFAIGGMFILGFVAAVN